MKGSRRCSLPRCSRSQLLSYKCHSLQLSNDSTITDGNHRVFAPQRSLRHDCVTVKPAHNVISRDITDIEVQVIVFVSHADSQ